MQQTQFLRMLYYSTVFLGFTSVTTEERKKIDFEVSHLEVILPVLVAFMEFILINEVVMWFMNKIVLLLLLLLLLLSLLLLLLLLFISPFSIILNRFFRSFVRNFLTDKLYACIFVSVVLYIRSGVCFSISCKRDVFDQFCLIFDQFSVYLWQWTSLDDWLPYRSYPNQVLSCPQ